MMQELLDFEQQGSGVPVVLLHGYCGSRRYWREAIPILARQCRVITPDLRGHHHSPAPEGIYAMEALAEDIIRLLDELQIGQAYVFGHSLGGYITLALAERHEDRLQGFGLIHSTSLPDTETAKEGRLQAAARIRAEGVKPFVDELVPKLFTPQNRKTMEHKVSEAKEIGYGTTPQGAVGCALGMRERPDRTEVLRRTGLPVLLVAGEHDEVVPPERRFPVDRPGVKCVTLPGVGHMGMMEDPERFCKEILTFLEECGGKPGV